MDETAPTPTPPHRVPWFLSWPVLALLLCLPGVLWALASPLFSAPDEPSHVVKAVALWHGQIAGDDSLRDNGYLTTTYQVPAVWAQGSAFRDCFAFAPDVTADCSPPFAGSESISAADSTAGHYPPLYSALVGWGGRLSAGPTGLYLMRITSALASGLLLTVAVRALLRVIDPRLAVAGVLVAVTPMVSFLAGAVNPNGLEIAAAIAVWCTLLAMLRWHDRHGAPVPRALAAQFGVAAVAVAVVRPLSPLFLAAIGGLALISVPWSSISRILRERPVQLVLGVIAAAAAIAMAAIVSSDILTGVPGRIGVGATNPALVILGETNGYISEMIGVFGWLDTPSPAFTTYAWLAAVFALVALGTTLGARRGALAILTTVAAAFVLPIAAQYPAAAEQGLAWQGRYTLPIAVGIPLLAVTVLGDRAAVVRSFVPRLTIGLAVLTGSASVAAFFWALRRYTTGASGSLRITSGAWQPPGGSALLLLAMVAGAAAFVAVLVLAGRRQPTAR